MHERVDRRPTRVLVEAQRAEARDPGVALPEQPGG